MRIGVLEWRGTFSELVCERKLLRCQIRSKAIRRYFRHGKLFIEETLCSNPLGKIIAPIIG